MSLSIGIRSLKTHCIIGIHKWERVIPQALIANISLTYAEGTEDSKTEPRIDYTRIHALFIQHCKQNKFHLVETLVVQFCEVLLDRFPFIQALSIEVQKPRALSGSKTAFVRLQYNCTKYDQLLQ